MKEIKVKLENGIPDEDGDYTYVAYAELFPEETRVEGYSEEQTKCDFEELNQSFFVENMRKFPEYKWTNLEIECNLVPDIEEHKDMYRITYEPSPDLIDG